MTIRRAIASALAVLAGVGVLVSAPTMAQAAPAAEVATPSPRTAPSVTWQWSWSDGGTQHRRAFSKRVYGSASNLPYLVVTNDSCAAGILIKLQFRENGRYYTEDRATTRGCNAARLHFNPYTESGRWAVGVYKERLIIPGLAYHYFTIEYTR